MTFPEYIKSEFYPAECVLRRLILIVSIPVMVYRFLFGLGPSTNLSDTNPWGIWIGIDVLCGIALAAGGLVIGTAYHLFGMKQYRHFVKPAILTSLLGYLFSVFGLLFDLREILPAPVSYGCVVRFFIHYVFDRLAFCALHYDPFYRMEPVPFRVVEHEKIP